MRRAPSAVPAHGIAARGSWLVLACMLLGGCTVAPVLVPAPPTGRPASRPASSSGLPKALRSSQMVPTLRQSPPAAAAAPAATAASVAQPSVPAPAYEGAAYAGVPAVSSPGPVLPALRAGLHGPDDAVLRRLRADAESAYQERQTQAAIEAFVMLVELDPQDARAWLRLGNLYQRKPDIAAAARAYRRAADLRTDGRESREVRQKALLNLTLLGIERSRQALSELDREALEPALTDARSDVRQQLDELVRGIDAALARQPAAASSTSSTFVAPLPPEALAGGAIDAAGDRQRRIGRHPASDATVDGPVDAAASAPRVAPRAAPRRADAAWRRPAGIPDSTADAANDPMRAEGPVRVDYLQGRPAR